MSGARRIAAKGRFLCKSCACIWWTRAAWDAAVSWRFVRGVKKVGLGVVIARYGLDCGFGYRWVGGWGCLSGFGGFGDRVLLNRARFHILIFVAVSDDAR